MSDSCEDREGSPSGNRYSIHCRCPSGAGLDYYTKTVYEITHSSLGARDAICAGGRYDNLISDIGGPSIGSVGFAIGMEATILALENVTAKRTNLSIRRFVALLLRCILFLSVKKQENNVSHCLTS